MGAASGTGSIAASRGAGRLRTIAAALLLTLGVVTGAVALPGRVRERRPWMTGARHCTMYPVTA